jgi:chromosome segregation protein
VVITHNKKTVTGADALLGVTMEESGVTKVIAVRLERFDGKLPEPVRSLSEIEDEEVEYENGTELPPEAPGSAAASGSSRGARSSGSEQKETSMVASEPGAHG